MAAESCNLDDERNKNLVDGNEEATAEDFEAASFRQLVGAYSRK